MCGMPIDIKRTLALSVLMLASACTWVPLEEEAAMVMLAKPSDVQNCKRLGTTETTSAAKIGVLPRRDAAIATELLTLGKNRAASMGGDTIVEAGPMQDGKQSFVIYDCSNRSGAI